MDQITAGQIRDFLTDLGEQSIASSGIAPRPVVIPLAPFAITVTLHLTGLAPISPVLLNLSGVLTITLCLPPVDVSKVMPQDRDGQESGC